jgi:ATP-dependent Clp protease ATP-binding subunit ClpE
VSYIADIGYSPEFGARPLKRAVQNSVSVPIAQYILKHPEAKKITLTRKNDHIDIS